MPKQSQIDEWRQRLRSYKIRTNSLATAYRYDDTLASVFSRFKNIRRMEDITPSRLADYETERKMEQAHKMTLSVELGTISLFYNFYIHMTQAPVVNPASVKNRRNYVAPRDVLLLSEMYRILDVAKAESLDYLFAFLLLERGVTPGRLVTITKDELWDKKLPEDLKALVDAMPEGRVLEGYVEGLAGLHKKWKELCWEAALPPKYLFTAHNLYKERQARKG